MEQEVKIVRNRARCLLCGDVLESLTAHDMKTCRCGNLSVDGGTDYIRRCFKNDSYEELSIEEFIEQEKIIDVTGAELHPGDTEHC